jgi:hypothetical protein
MPAALAAGSRGELYVVLKSEARAGRETWSIVRLVR